MFTHVDPGSWFDIDSISGNISTAQRLDRNSPLLGPQGTVILNVTVSEPYMINT